MLTMKTGGHMINEYLNLKIKIYNTIILSYTKKDTFVMNQKGELFTKSMPKQYIKEYKKYLLGGLVHIFNEKYNGALSFDFNGISKSTKYISFCSFTEHSGENFKEFYSKILNGKKEDFIWLYDLRAYNIKSQIKEINSIQINNTRVDSSLTKQICSLFPLLESIEFNNCVVASDCAFITDHKIEINFNDCILESSLCLIDSKNDFNFVRCNFKQINTNIITSCSCYSHHISMFECDINFFSLFLKTNFPDLEYLRIEHLPEYNEKGNNYQKDLGNSFTFLPDSCPHLNRLRIAASLDNIDFLSRMPFLESITIFSSSGDMDFPLLKLNDYKATKKLEEKNKTRIKIKQILDNNYNAEEKEYYITESEMERILKMNNFYKTFYTTPYEAETLIKFGNNFKDLVSYLLKPDFLKLDGYYENYFSHLMFRHLKSDAYNITGKLKEMKYLYNSLFYDEPKDKIVLTKKCLFYIDGRPIIFNNETRMKPITTEQEALEFRRKYPVKPSKNNDLTEDYINQLKEAVQMNVEYGLNNVTVSEFVSNMQTVSSNISLSLVYKDLLRRLESGHEIIYKLYKEEEKWHYIEHLRKAYEKCLIALVNLINRNYSSFTVEELIIIAKYLPEERSFESNREFNCNPYFDLHTLYLDEASLIKDIDLKCKGNFTKLLKSINNMKVLESNLVKKEAIITEEDQIKIKTLSLKKSNYLIN